MSLVSRFAGRVAIVTGAGRGIGRATAELLAAEGAAVVVNDIGVTTLGEGGDLHLADEVAGAIVAAGGRAVANHDSVAEYSSAQRIVAQAETELGPVDILVNNAGLTGNVPAVGHDPDLFHRIVASHLHGTFNCCQHVLPGMLARGRGRVVNLLSRSGLVGTAGTSAYGAAKGAVFGYGNVVARELVGTGVTMNAVVPSATRTRQVMEVVERAKGGEDELGSLADGLLAVVQEPEDVAVLIAALATDEAAGINGQVFLARGEEVGIFPRLDVTDLRHREGGWSIAALIEALPTFGLNPMTDPYRMTSEEETT